MKRLARRRALVIGAHRGAGAAAAVALGRAGAAVVCADRRLAGETVATIRAAGGRAETWQCDVADADSVSALLAAAGEGELPLDVAVFAPAAPADAALTHPDSFDAALLATLGAAVRVAREAEALMARRAGCILFVLPDPAASATARAVAAAMAALVPALAASDDRGARMAAVARAPGASDQAAARLVCLLAGADGEGMSGQVLTAHDPDAGAAG